MCPGRNFAMLEVSLLQKQTYKKSIINVILNVMQQIKMLVASMMEFFEVKSLEGQTIPEVDVTRAGIGVLPPVCEYNFLLRPKSNQCELKTIE